ncbi:anti-sigma factor family protein [Jidongwangia harbinensis]|uniref:anti-sigma factor family protein n=1 Tax=Jidongwangia harbinensis TaxID=2878561 RepID=UPI001CD953D1|nr:zf-HC2 domain-containing protein [Jidongwangia harbinensis]MCA2214469.1 zf-HC2 domain-containing protein [Jidongwangia harbinensis]
MSVGDHDELRRLLGGYLLGGLDEADTDRLDAHLRDCDDCRTELDRLAAVPELLKRLPEAQRAAGAVTTAAPVIAIGTRPSAERIEGLLRKMRAERSRSRRIAGVRWLAAAAVVMIAAVIGFGVVTADRGGRQPQVLPSPQLVTAQFESAAGSGLSGEAVLTPKTWGVSVALDVSRLEGDGPFVCQVRNTSGETEQAAVWGPTPTGSAKVIGASSIQLSNVSAIAIADREGHVLGTAEVS